MNGGRAEFEKTWPNGFGMDVGRGAPSGRQNFSKRLRRAEVRPPAIAAIGATSELLRGVAFDWMSSRAKPWRCVAVVARGEVFRTPAQFTVCGAGSRSFSDLEL